MSKFYFICYSCGYDSDEAGKLADSLLVFNCPVCASNCDCRGKIHLRPAIEREIRRIEHPKRMNGGAFVK